MRSFNAITGKEYFFFKKNVTWCLVVLNPLLVILVRTDDRFEIKSEKLEIDNTSKMVDCRSIGKSESQDEGLTSEVEAQKIM